MAAIDEYQPEYTENIEKSLTNVNVVIATIAKQHHELGRSYQDFSIMFNKQQQVHYEQLTRAYQDFSANFNKQQELLFEEMNLIRMEVRQIRKDLKKGD